MDIATQISSKLTQLLNKKYYLSLDEKEIYLEHPQDKDHGDWATNIAMVLAKELKKSPQEIAKSLFTDLQEDELFKKVEIAGPGFINFFIKDEVYGSTLNNIIEQGKSYGNGDMYAGKRMRVEFAHPNPFKSFHIGHLRNIILGESIVRLLESQGAEVIRTNYQGDVGMHIAKCLWAFAKLDPKEYPQTNDEKVALLGKCYAQGATAFEDDEAVKKEITEINKKIYSKVDKQINDLWELGKKWSLDKFHEIYKRVDTYFDREFMESETLEQSKKYIQEALDKGILQKSEGAIILDGSKYGIDTRVYLNSEGLPTYEGKELGLAFLEFNEFGDFDLRIHVVAVEQISFFKSTFKAKELLDPKLFKDKQYHLAYEFVGLKKGKMSSRKGQVVLGNDILNTANEKIKEIIKDREEYVLADEQLEVVAVGAIKYSFLKVSPFTYLAFDLDESINFEGDSGPYVQYTFARANSILQKQSNDKTGNSALLVEDEEKLLIKHLDKFPEVVINATKDYSPHFLANYLFELSQKFNSFYKKFPVLKAEEELKQARLLLVSAVAQVIENGLNLLGIKTLKRM